MLFHKPLVAERLEREGSQHAKVLGKTKETNVSVFVFTLVFLVVLHLLSIEILGSVWDGM